MKAEWTNSDSLTTTQTTKAILVVDMPTNCNECVVKCDGYTAKQYAEKGIRRPSWCPLRPLPSKRRIPFTKTFGTPFKKGKANGWNDCLDEILGETNESNISY